MESVGTLAREALVIGIVVGAVALLFLTLQAFSILANLTP